MRATMLEMLSGILTIEQMVLAFQDEERCRRLLEGMVWPDGRVCPSCGYKRSIAIAGRDMGKRRARPGLYQCSSGDCRFQFTVTTHTPLHSTKLPLRTWLKAMWLLLQSDKGLSSVRLAETLGVSQPTAWRIGHALRLMVARENMLAGTVEIDHFHLGGRPRKRPDEAPPGRGRKGQANTEKTTVLGMVQRPADRVPGTLAGDARAAVVTGLSLRAAEAIGEGFTDHETVNHSSREYVRDAVHVNSVEGFNSRIRRTIAGVFPHISPQHADLYFHEMGFRWSQRIVTGQAVRKTRRGRQVVQTLWSRVSPAPQLMQVFRSATGRQMRRSPDGGIIIKSAVTVFG
ncbi:IS1595 family transposase [Mesorhizobium sp. INR15]|uniref:IS1595 family transposase n=1 Tax=Mesorhizobium sp. INR15 TaxID=2654248 RepID=UPI0018966E7E|nr:IS1595 family transposase [Mesorhizobium sp. INR15]QPC95457.1 IS1595 family transposase [Mesorhizobium sp. INR15]